MKKLFTVLCLLLCTHLLCKAQTTATDFTAQDCNGANQHLFSQLDGGNIIVLVWVMPCSACISDAKAAYDAVQSFASSHPGKVKYWLSDDNGNNTCSSLNSWASTNSIGPNMTVFDNAGNVIVEQNYGGTGMPHVVVMGGTDHHIFLNIRNGSNDGTAITTAINQALTLSVNDLVNIKNLTVFPNPATNKMNVSFVMLQTSDVQLEILDLQGRTWSTTNYKQLAGSQSLPVNIDNSLSSGNYLLRLKTNYGVATRSFTINR